MANGSRLSSLEHAWTAIPPLRRGAICMVIVTLSFTIMDAAAKWLGSRYDPLLVVWYRYAVQVVLVALLLAPSLPVLIRAKRPGIQVLRSGFLFAATIFFFFSLSLMPLADVAAIAQTAPLFITALAAMVLGEQVGIRRWAGVLVGFAGAMIILRPGFSDAGWVVLLPLIGTACFALLNISTRFLEGHDSVWTTFLFTGLVGGVAASAIVPWVWAIPAWEHVPIFIGMGVVGTLGQFLLIIALSTAPASALAPLLYLTLIWSTVAGYLIFDTLPDVWTAVGASLIVGAGLYVQHRARVRARAAKASSAS
jgi:drug/metabolite transporter (DMT)-like permease